MRETLPPSLPPGLTALLDAERAREGLSTAAKERILARLEHSVSLPRPRSFVWPVLGAFATGLVLGAALCGVLLGSRLHTAAPPQVLMIDSPPPPAPVLVIVRPAAPPAVAPPGEPSPAARQHVAAGSAESSVQTDATDQHDSELARERALVETARTALSRKQPDVIDLLLLHAQQFPQGRLAEERESLLVQALLQAGRADEARSHAAQFRKRWPRSLLLPVIDAAVGTIP